MLAKDKKIFVNFMLHKSLIIRCLYYLNQTLRMELYYVARQLE